MIKKSTSFISMCLLIIWSMAQCVDAWHHIHESHEEEVCEIGIQHFCKPHVEVELCELCTVVHGNATQQIPALELHVEESNVENADKSKSEFCSSFLQTRLSRGPPTQV